MLVGKGDLEHVRTLNVMGRAGRRLQLIKAKERRGHYPVHCDVNLEMDTESSSSEERHDRVRWDYDHMAVALKTGRDREMFVIVVEARLERDKATADLDA